MPDPNKKKKEDEDLLEDEESEDEEIENEEEENEEEESEDGSTVIDLDEENEEDDEETKRKKKNKAFAKMRIRNKELEKENKDLKEKEPVVQQQYQRPQQTDDGKKYYKGVAVPETEKEWDELADKDWKTAVDMRSVINTQTIVQSTARETSDNKSLSESKQKVIARHPELNDINSEKSKIYLRILDDNPGYVKDPRGPIHAMRDMEEYMEEVLGYKRGDIVKAEKKGAQDEATRHSRVKLMDGSGKKIVTNANKVTLSKEELEFCTFHSIDPKEYARNKKLISKSKGGLQV